MIYKIKQYNLTVKDLENIENTNDSIFVPESDYGLAEIYYRNGKFEVFEIPMYGGAPILGLTDTNAQVVLDYVKNLE